MKYGMSLPPDGAARLRPTILCVDDEPHVLEGLAMHLRRVGEVLPATSGRDALTALETQPDVAVVISDMRMPHMDGAAFLARARAVAPHAVRILLTGQTELDSAINAVNEGQIFRFLTKPCPPSLLARTVEAALEQHRLLTAERVLLEQTLHGSIKALTDVLAIVDPSAFGRASRIKRLATDLCNELGISERWYIEVAAMLLPLGDITLPDETREKLQRGLPLEGRESDMLARVPLIVEQLLGNIPRLEQVRELLVGQLKTHDPRSSAVPEPRTPEARRALSLLRIAADYDALIASGIGKSAALTKLTSQSGRYDALVFEALGSITSSAPNEPSGLGRLVALGELRVGMVFAEDVRSRTGILVAAQGFEVTEGFIERVRNLRAGSLPMALRVR